MAKTYRREPITPFKPVFIPSRAQQRVQDEIQEGIDEWHATQDTGTSSGEEQSNLQTARTSTAGGSET